MGIAQRKGSIFVTIICFLIVAAVAFVFTTENAFAAPPFKKTRVTVVSTAVVGNNTVRVTWRNQPAADGFVVYYSLKKKSGYRTGAVAGKKSVRVNVKRLVVGRTYYFKVRAFKKSGRKRIYGKYSKVVGRLITPAAPAVNAVAVEPYIGRIKVTFTRCSGAGGYEIWRSVNSRSGYKRVGILGPSANTYLGTGLAANKWYYYRVRAYTFVKKKKLYGPFSGITGDMTGGNSKQFDLGRIPVDNRSSLRGKKILFLGSSITYGYSSGGISFPEYLARRDGVVAEKRAVSGTTISNIAPQSYVERLRGISADRQRKLVVCQLSTNDAGNVNLKLNKDPVKPEQPTTPDQPANSEGSTSLEGQTVTGQAVQEPLENGKELSQPENMEESIEEAVKLGAFDESGNGELPVDLDELYNNANTVRGAIDYIMAYSKEKLNCPVVFYVVPPYNAPDNYRKMIDVLYQAVDEWTRAGYEGHIMDMQKTNYYPQFNGFNTFNETRAFYMGDAVHPTRAGYYRKYLPAFESFLKRII